jgi:hypothetical protein
MYQGYAKVLEDDAWVCSDVFSMPSHTEVEMRAKAWLFDNAFDCETPYIIMVKPEQGGSYECIVDNKDAFFDLLAHACSTSFQLGAE